MAKDVLNAFREALAAGKNGEVVTTVTELRANQFGLPLPHFAQQYLFGSTALRIRSFVSIQGDKGVGKSTLVFDLMGYAAADKSEGGQGGICVLYELEDKISPSILYSILSGYGERAKAACLLRTNMTLDSAMIDLNKTVLNTYKEVVPDRSAPLIIDLDSIGGAAGNDTVEKLEKEGLVGKGFGDKQHHMKHFCENETMRCAENNIPAIFICVNQEKEAISVGGPTGRGPQKTITGGKSQGFKDSYMIRVSKEQLASGDGNLLKLSTVKASFSDSRKIEVLFKWNKFGKKTDDAYEARFLWALASAKCLATPEKGVDELREICNVSVSNQNLVTCPQLGLKSVSPEEFEAALMANQEILDKLYMHMKIEKVQGLDGYAAYLKSRKAAFKEKDDDKADKPKKDKPKKASKAKGLKAKPEPEPEESEAAELAQSVSVLEMNDSEELL